MPRIRSIKPESLQHRKVGRLTDREFRLWIGMLTQADDDGRLVADTGQLKLLVFGYFPRVTVGDVEASVRSLAEVGLIRRYTVAGVQYADFPSWRDHQRINRPTPSKLPSYEESMSAHGGLTEESVKTHEGSDRIGSERSTTSSGPSPRPHVDPNGTGSGPEPGPASLRRDQAVEILAYLNQLAGRSFRPVDATLKPIQARLASGVTVEACKAIIARKVRNWRGDPKMAHYLRPETLFNATKFESYLGEAPPAADDDDEEQP